MINSRKIADTKIGDQNIDTVGHQYPQSGQSSISKSMLQATLNQRKENGADKGRKQEPHTQAFQ